MDEETLLGALRHWYRFAGHGAVPLADLRYWMARLRSAGRDGGTAAVMHIASHAEGEVTIYERARDYLAVSALTSWPERGYNVRLGKDRNTGQYHRVGQVDRWLEGLKREELGLSK